MRPPTKPHLDCWPRAGRRGSMLLTAMLLSLAIGLGLVGYLNLSRNSLKLSQRTYYLNCTANLAEAGLEEAVYCYRLMNGGTAASTAWAGWTLSGSNATYTLPSFSLGQNAIGTVKVFVYDYLGTGTKPSIYSQATILPLDGGQKVQKTLKVRFSAGGTFNALLAASGNINLNPNNTVDSWNSNPTGSASATRVAYPGNGAGAAANLTSTGGAVSLGNRTVVNGNVMVSAGKGAPSASQVTGTINTNYTGTAAVTPTAPAWSSATTGYYSLAAFPAVLPRVGDVPAADGRYYYYPSSTATLGTTTITAGKNVSLRATTVSAALTLGLGSTLTVYSGDVDLSSVTNPNWAGALQFYSWGTTFNLPKAATTAVVYAPLAPITLSGGGGNQNFYGAIVAKSVNTSGQWAMHYDESLTSLSTPIGSTGSLGKWYDLQGMSELPTLPTLTGGFLN